jgi:lipopolysaccharide export system permease protein
LRSLLFNYVIALFVMMCLYMLLDLFVNIDEFTETGESLRALLHNIADYYAAHSLLYFSQLSGVITLFACLVTLARMRRGNELTAMLSSGVSLYRVAVPVVAFGLATSVLWYVDVEVLIPRAAHRLARTHEDATGSRARGVWFVKDADRSLLSALEFTPAEGELRHMLVLQRDTSGSATSVIEADRATWERVPGHPHGGVWRLVRGVERRRTTEDATLGPRASLEPKPVEAYETALGPAEIEARQARQWLSFTSAARLSHLGEGDPSLLSRIRQIKHGRFAAPLVHLLMLLLGLPFFLGREPANVIADSGKAVVVCGLCFLLAFASENFVVSSTLSALPAWLPLIVFSPVAVVMFDRIRT